MGIQAIFQLPIPRLDAIVGALLGYAVFLVLYQIIYYRFFHPLSKFPGPFWGSVTRLWITYHNVLGQETEACQAMHERYGPVIRITPTMILVSDATKLPVIYHRAVDKSKHFLSGAFGKEEALFNMGPHKVHARFRKLIAGAYTFTNIKKMEPLIDTQVQNWLDQIEIRFGSSAQNGIPATTADTNTTTNDETSGPAHVGLAKSGISKHYSGSKPNKVDLYMWARYLAYDVVSDIGFGAPFGFIDRAEDIAGLIKGTRDGLLPFGIMARLYPFTNWLQKTWVGERYLVAKPTDASGFGTTMRFRDGLIDKRFRDIESGSHVRRDLLQTFIDTRDENGQPLSLDYIKVEVLVIILAGADTTATAIQAFFKYVVADRAVYSKVMNEIDSAMDSGKLSRPVPSHDEVMQHCPYYVACIREAMRLDPSSPSIFPRLVAKGGIELNGMHVPEGMEVTANPFLVQRDRNIYGEDADIFVPERWLEPEKAQMFHRYSMAFGYGSRACLGKDIAFMELLKGPLLFLRNFEVEFPDPEKPTDYVVKGGVALLENMWVQVKSRY